MFAVETLPAGTMLERAPFLVLDPADTANPPLNDYVFSVTHDRRSKLYGQLALVLGWGGLFNHADPPNVEHRIDLRRRCFEFVSTAVILAGEQCFVSYGEAWWAGRQRTPR